MMQLAVAERCVTSRARAATAADQPLYRIGRNFRTAPLDIRCGVHGGRGRPCVALANRRSPWHLRVEAGTRACRRISAVAAPVGGGHPRRTIVPRNRNGRRPTSVRDDEERVAVIDGGNSD